MSKARKEIQQLLNKYAVTNAPVPVADIAREEGISVIFKPYHGTENISGVLIREHDRSVIGINSNNKSTRQRFSIAHELGHFFLHKGEIFVDVSHRLNLDSHAELNFRQSPTVTGIKPDKKEIEANEFAAELLMPRSFIESEITNILDENPDLEVDALIDGLCRQFEVSQKTMEHRLRVLGMLVGD